MRILQRGDTLTRFAQALAEFGRIEKTLYTLHYLDDEAQRRATLTPCQVPSCLDKCLVIPFLI